MASVPDDLETRRIAVFLFLAFGISWAVGGVIYVMGGLRDSPELIPGFTMATVMLAGGYMFGPALANVLTRLATGEGWADAWLRPRFRAGWPYWAAAWFLPAVLTLLGVGVFYALFPEHFDPTMEGLRGTLAGATGGAEIDPSLVALLQLASALTIGPLINSVFTFGEEFGWRGYLLPKLLPLGHRRAALAVGAIWGVWHWPVVLMGYNYGFGYAGAPWTGLLAMVWFTLTVGVFLAWVTMCAGSVWPAVVGHAAINAVAGYGVLFVRGTPSSLLGPATTGVVASLPWAALALVLLWRRDALAPVAVEN